MTYADHVYRALEVHLAAGEGKGGAPLPSPGLGGEAFYAFPFVIESLMDGGVRLVATRR